MSGSSLGGDLDAASSTSGSISVSGASSTLSTSGMSDASSVSMSASFKLSQEPDGQWFTNLFSTLGAKSGYNLGFLKKGLYQRLDGYNLYEADVPCSLFVNCGQQYGYVYKIDEKKLGEGSFGSVYPATCKITFDLNDSLAPISVDTKSRVIKIQTVSNKSEEKQFQETVNKEVLIQDANGLKTEASIFYREQDDNHPLQNAIIMPRAPGKSLEEVLGGKDRVDILNLSYEDCLRLALATAEKIAFIHESKPGKPAVIHKDLKPANIIWASATNEVTILDFGMARDEAEGETGPYAFGGTFGYFAPEVVFEKKLTTKVDIYSFVVIVAEIFGCPREQLFPNPSMPPKTWFDKALNFDELLNNRTKPDYVSDADFKSEKTKILEFLVLASSRDPEQRPDIQQMVKFFEERLSNLEKYKEQYQANLHQAKVQISQLPAEQLACLWDLVPQEHHDQKLPEDKKPDLLGELLKGGLVKPYYLRDAGPMHEVVNKIRDGVANANIDFIAEFSKMALDKKRADDAEQKRRYEQAIKELNALKEQAAGFKGLASLGDEIEGFINDKSSKTIRELEEFSTNAHQDFYSQAPLLALRSLDESATKLFGKLYHKSDFSRVINALAGVFNPKSNSVKVDLHDSKIVKPISVNATWVSRLEKAKRGAANPKLCSKRGDHKVIQRGFAKLETKSNDGKLYSQLNTVIKDIQKVDKGYLNVIAQFNILTAALNGEKFEGTNSTGIKRMQRVLNSSMDCSEKLRLIIRTAKVRQSPFGQWCGRKVSLLGCMSVGKGRDPNVCKLYKMVFALRLETTLDGKLAALKNINQFIAVNDFLHQVPAIQIKDPESGCEFLNDRQRASASPAAELKFDELVAQAQSMCQNKM